MRIHLRVRFGLISKKLGFLRVNYFLWENNSNIKILEISLLVSISYSTKNDENFY